MHQNYWAEYSALSHEDQRELLWVKLPWLFFLVILDCGLWHFVDFLASGIIRDFQKSYFTGILDRLMKAP
jgi:hypothetical protein